MSKIEKINGKIVDAVMIIDLDLYFLKNIIEYKKLLKNFFQIDIINFSNTNKEGQ